MSIDVRFTRKEIDDRGWRWNLEVMKLEVEIEREMEMEVGENVEGETGRSKFPVLHFILSYWVGLALGKMDATLSLCTCLFPQRQRGKERKRREKRRGRERAGSK